jgi:hypothetical protein
MLAGSGWIVDNSSVCHSFACLMLAPGHGILSGRGRVGGDPLGMVLEAIQGPRGVCEKRQTLFGGSLYTSCMTNKMRGRDPNRFLKIMEERLAHKLHTPIEIVPLAAVPKAVLGNARLSRPRRPKGIPKRPRRAPHGTIISPAR